MTTCHTVLNPLYSPSTSCIRLASGLPCFDFPQKLGRNVLYPLPNQADNVRVKASSLPTQQTRGKVVQLHEPVAIMCVLSKSTLHQRDQLITLVRPYLASGPHWYSSYCAAYTQLADLSPHVMNLFSNFQSLHALSSNVLISTQHSGLSNVLKGSHNELYDLILIIQHSLGRTL